MKEITLDDFNVNSLDIYADHPSFKNKNSIPRKTFLSNGMCSRTLYLRCLILTSALFLTCSKATGKATYFVHCLRRNIEIHYHRGSFLCLNSISILLQNKSKWQINRDGFFQNWYLNIKLFWPPQQKLEKTIGYI